MDDFKELKEIVPILIFLLPGFLTGKMLDLLVVAKSKDVFDRIVQAFVFTFIKATAKWDLGINHERHKRQTNGIAWKQ